MKNINYAILRSFIKIISFAILISFSFSCNDYMNEEKSLQYVVYVFPNAKIYQCGEEKNYRKKEYNHRKQYRRKQFYFDIETFKPYNELEKNGF